MNAVVLIDKPQGISSHDVVSKLRKALKIQKIGHAGTLDPKASGLLILCVGKATKVSQYLMGQDKVYTVDVVFGKTTTSYDEEGEVVTTSEERPTKNQILAALPSFTGKLLQKPPIYSAIKKQGTKLYEYARSGESVDIEPRAVKIDQIELLAFVDGVATLKVSCSKGTYIRSLAHDLGQLLACGAFAKNIRRLQSGLFHIDQSSHFSDVLREPTQIKSISIGKVMKEVLPSIVLNDCMVEKIKFGQTIAASNLETLDQSIMGELVLFDQRDEAVGIVFLDQGLLKAKRVF